MKKLLIFSALFIMSCSAQIKAQSLSEVDIKVQMIKEWERAKDYTVEYLNTMPADKYSFRAVDSIRSFAQQMLHLAQVNLFLMSSATDLTPPAFLKADLEHSATAQSKDSVMYYVTQSYDYCIHAIKSMNIKSWGEKKKIFGHEETRFALMLKAFEHQTHHRGQTTIYIRLVGIRPPQERLF
ncbi:MAG: damage-inducible protein DinB [Bacteroidetes bacterium]|nr:damage-inducible protein DinB [Bacteroidota bacterium]